MFQQIDSNANMQPEDVAQAISAIWGDNKVVHVKRAFEGTPDELRSFYDRVLENLGRPVDIAEDATAARDAQRTGERWMEIRYDPTIPDAYRHSANAQPLHTDGSYIPAFPDAAIIYCQASANNGGETVFVDSDVVISALEAEAPELLKRLKSHTVKHARSGDERDAPIVANDNIGVKLHWNYYCVDKDADADTMALREEFHTFLQSSKTVQESKVAVALRPGDCVIWKDDRTLHGRNAFDPTVKSERFLWKSAVEVGAANG